MRKALLILAVIVVVVIVWAYLFTGTPPWGPKFTPKDAAVSAIELSWLGTNRTIRASNQCADVLQTMRKARHSRAVATPFFGSLTLYYADGSTNLFYLCPSDRISGLQITGESGGCYVISLGQMLDTFQSVGLLTKDQR